MKKSVMLFLPALLMALPAWGGETQVLKSHDEAVSYAVGVEMARNFKRDEFPVSREMLVKGIEDELSGKELLLSERQRRALIRQMQSQAMAKLARKHKEDAEKNLKAEEEFLAANKVKPGVVTLPGGTQYRVVKAGAGWIPSENDIVECNYTASYLDGTEFDGSDPGIPVKMRVAKLLPGWKEAIEKMPEGSTWDIYVPSKLAYGEKGAGVDIGPNQALIFHVELVAIK